ncbi:MAG: hypothetical protein ACUVWN_02235 [bacterium]
MIKWVMFELIYKNSPVWWKILFAINSLTRGVLSVIFGNFKHTSKWSAKVAYKNFKGISEENIKCLINFTKNGKYLLTLNPKFIDIVSEIRKIKKIPNEEVIELSIHSQGTCKKMIELFINRNDIKGSLNVMKVKVSRIYANQLEIFNGRFTGNITGQIITKYNKINNIPKGCIFIGDNHDEKAITKSKNWNFEFIKLQ